MKITVVGTGYVGLVTGTCLAELGNKVICLDNDRAKIALLKRGQMPIYERGLEDLVKKNTGLKRLSFSNNLNRGIDEAEVIFIAVGTPPRPDGSADLSNIEEVARCIAKRLKKYKLIVEKSTVPVETGEQVFQSIKRYGRPGVEFDVASNPEFLREGSAVDDFLHPDRIVLGVNTEKAAKILQEIYRPLNAPILVTDIKSAELIKHASNSFLATKISFINAVANICERVGADVVKVAEGMGLDKRIGRSFLNAGAGFGGFCFPKDLEAFLFISHKLGYNFELLSAVKNINEQQKKIVCQKIEEALWIIKGKTIGFLGLAFKPDTDDMRFAPSIEIINYLVKAGAKIKAYDPAAMPKAKSVLPKITYSPDAYTAAKNSDALVVITEWAEFKKLDFTRIKKIMRTPVLIDARNIYQPKKMQDAGFIYKSIGRG
ncbi:MAG: UDP-glucose/GDP-mannose dehydrogenase family protein [Elusimicrobiota bacterium]